MPQSRLRKQLEKRNAWGEVSFVIPHIILPPRYQKLGQSRDMLLSMDDLQQLRIRWRGARLEEYHPLTPKQAQRLIAHVVGYLAKYRDHLQVFSRFVESVGEVPEVDVNPLDFGWESAKGQDDAEAPLKPATKEGKKGKSAAQGEVVAVIQRPPGLSKAVGGESPMGKMDMGV